jgi:RNA polymerase sigma-70 factor, ECF subfamily
MKGRGDGVPAASPRERPFGSNAMQGCATPFLVVRSEQPLAESNSGPAPEGDSRQNEAFVQLLAGEQTRLLHYVVMLLGDIHEAQNVLQEANLVLWRKAREFEPGTNFSAWARRVAYWQVQAYIRDRRRDRLVFDEQLAEQLSRIEPEESVGDETRLALRHCLSGLRPAHRRLLKLRYDRGLSITNLAERMDRSQSAIKVGLLRIRRVLLKCIEKKMADAAG